MKRCRHTPEQIVRKLREADRLLGEEKDIAEALRHLEVSEATLHRWRNQYGGMKAEGAKRLRELERENGRLKQVVAEQAQKARKRRRGQSTDTGGAPRRAAHPGEVWAIDFQFDATNDGRQLKSLNIVDEHTRQALATEVARSCDADGLLRVLDRLQAQHGAPGFLRMDNRPELTAQALRDWARLNTTGTIYIEPGSPWENPYVESFNSRMRDEHWNTEEFTALTETQILTETWRIEYNTIRPHSALVGLTPDEYAAVWITTTHKQDQPTPTLS